MERMQLTPGKDRPTSRFWYRSQSLCPKGRAMFLYRLRWTLVDYGGRLGPSARSLVDCMGVGSDHPLDAGRFLGAGKR